MSKKPHKRPGLRVLAKYARGEKDIMKYWSKFIENDAKCRADVDVLKKLDLLFERSEIAQVSHGSKKLASEIFSQFQACRGITAENVAHLFYDSQAIPLREGFRPSLMSERRLKYAGEAGTIELSVVPVFPGRFELTGRLEGSPTDATAAVRLRGRRSMKTGIDEFGFFSFGAVNPGIYKLHFKAGGKEVVIRDLTLR